MPAPVFELHYHLRDGKHSMSAFVRNKAEFELLGAITRLLDLLQVDVLIEATAAHEGGLREKFKLVTRQDALTVLGIVAAMPGTIAAVLTYTSSQDPEKARLEKEALSLTIEERKLVIEKLKRDLQKTTEPSRAPPKPTTDGDSLELESPTHPLSQYFPSKSQQTAIALLASDGKFKVRRSNFFRTLIPYPEVTAVGFGISLNHETKEQKVPRSRFLKYLAPSTSPEPHTVPEAVIHIAAPVLSEGNLQWRGFFEGKPISFAMKDSHFREMVMRKEVSFKHGNAIRCRLEIETKADEDGNPVVISYSVPVVIEKLDETGAVETPQGRRQRYVDKHASAQQQLNFPEPQGGRNDEEGFLTVEN